MHSYHSGLYHCVFSTKDRRACIAEDVRDRLWAYLGGTAREFGLKVLAVGGMDDHVHILLSFPSTIGVAEGLQKIKANSSRWLREQGYRFFSWQKGYGAFSIGVSQVNATVRYIQAQEKHHRRIDFRDELRTFLEKHGIPLQDEL